MVLLAGIISCYSLCFSQKILSLSQCLSLAQKNNVQLRKARAGVQSSLYFQQETIAGLYPQFRILGNATYIPHTNTWGYDSAVTDGGELFAQVSASQPIHLPKTIHYLRNSAKLDHALVKTQLVRTERDVAISVEEQFIGTLAGQSELNLRQESAKRLSDYTDIVRLQNKGGAAGYSDLLKAKTQLFAAQEAVITTAESTAIAKMNLALLIGLPLDTSFQLAGSLDTIVDSVLKLHFTIDTIFNPDLLAANYSMEQGTFNLALTYRSWYPQVSIIADAGYLSSVDRIITAGSKATFGFTIGATLDMPLVDWGVIKNRRLRQQFELDTLRSAIVEQRNMLFTNFNVLLLQYSNASSILQLVQQRVSDAKQDYELILAKYAAGAATSTDLLLAQETFTNATIDAVTAKSSIITFATKLQQYTKKP